MNKLFRNTIFNIGFYGGLTLFWLINYLTYIRSYNDAINPPNSEIRFSVIVYKIGFPFTFYTDVTANPNYTYFDWAGLIANIIIAVVFSFITGFVCKTVWSKISSRYMK